MIPPFVSFFIPVQTGIQTLSLRKQGATEMLWIPRIKCGAGMTRRGGSVIKDL